MKVGELIPAPKQFRSMSTVPAGKAATAELGVLGISFGIKQPTGDTSQSTMPKYKTIRGKTQGTK